MEHHGRHHGIYAPAAYFILRDGVPYRDLGPDHFDRLDRGKLLRRLMRKIEDLGYNVEVTRAA